MQLRPSSWLHKSSHHEISTTAEQEIMLRRAAELNSQSLSEFILASACASAALAIQDQRQYFVSGTERRSLMALQERPGTPIPALVDLLGTPLPWNGESGIEAPQALAAQHSIHAFDCGKKALNDWLTHHARITQHKGLTNTYVCCTKERVIAYFSLSVGQVDSMEIPGHGAIALERDAFPVPVVILTRLAVDRHYQGSGLGRALLLQAIEHAEHIAGQAGVEALLTQPIDEQAARFYQSSGFSTSPAAYKQLLLMIKDIQSSRAASCAQQDGQ